MTSLKFDDLIEINFASFLYVLKNFACLFRLNIFLTTLINHMAYISINQSVSQSVSHSVTIHLYIYRYM